MRIIDVHVQVFVKYIVYCDKFCFLHYDFWALKRGTVDYEAHYMYMYIHVP